jgi:hypothetical protein
MNVTVTTYRAIDHPDICEAFIEGHIAVLEDFGIQNVTSNTREWMKDPGVYVVVAVNDETGELIGGVRVQIYDGKNSLPIQRALEDLDPRINDIVRERHHEGVSEGCGLWNSKRVFGRGISYILTRCSVALAGLLPVKTLLALSAPYTRETAMERGYNILDTIGDHGYFDYPIPTHRACALMVSNLDLLPGPTLESERAAIALIRSRNGVNLTESFNGRSITVTYNLLP